MSLRIELLGEGDIPQACQLFHTVFGAQTNENLWRWKFASGPRLGSVNVVAKSSDGELLGHAAATVFPGAVQGRSLAMAQVCDVMVAPQARSAMESGNTYRRLMVRLQRELQTRYGSTLAYGFAGIRPFTLGKRMGFYREVHPCRSIAYTAPAHISLSRTWSVQRHDWDCAAVLDAAWAAQGSRSASPRVTKSAAYMAWRYASHPTHQYQLWFIKRFWNVRGWIVTRTMPDHSTCIIDAMWPEYASISHLLHALFVQLGSVAMDPAPVLWGWHVPNQLIPATEPIICLEVEVHAWRDDLAKPQFHPGDTDVF